MHITYGPQDHGLITAFTALAFLWPGDINKMASMSQETTQLTVFISHCYCMVLPS